MAFDLKDKNSGIQLPAAIQLPAVLAIGFTGHRNLPDEARSRRLIYDFLAEKKASTPEILLGVSSVAAGGDLLFAESCIALEIPLRVLLPLTREAFRKDFDEATWSRAEEAMRRAISVELVGKDGQRDECYYECGLETVMQSQWQVALWNGEPARGLGGTEQVVAFARSVGRPVVWIHSGTGKIEVLGEKLPAIEVDPELRILNRLEAMDVRLGERSATGLSAAWLAKLDVNAVRVAPQVRRLAAVPIVCTAMAAVVSGGASRMHSSGIWVAVGALLGLTAAVLPAVLKLGKRQALWVRIRTAAEVSRAIRAVWDAPIPYEVVGPEILPELRGMIVSLNFLKFEAGRKGDGGVELFKQKYLEERLLDQKRYFLGQSTKAAEKARRYRLISKACVIGAILMSVWTFGGRSLLKTSYAMSGGSWLPLVASAFFQMATIAGALLVVNDCDRRQRRYLEIYHSLTNWEAELRAFHTWHPVTQVVNKIERALLVELLEWRSLLQNTKMPRK
jgi:hypothetical protein